MTRILIPLPLGTRAHINIKTVFPGMNISVIDIRQSWDCLFFIMIIPMLARWCLHIETPLRGLMFLGCSSIHLSNHPSVHPPVHSSLDKPLPRWPTHHPSDSLSISPERFLAILTNSSHWCILTTFKTDYIWSQSVNFPKFLHIHWVKWDKCSIYNLSMMG